LEKEFSGIGSGMKNGEFQKIIQDRHFKSEVSLEKEFSGIGGGTKNGELYQLKSKSNLKLLISLEKVFSVVPRKKSSEFREFRLECLF
jgi:hypothetical protein